MATLGYGHGGMFGTWKNVITQVIPSILVRSPLLSEAILLVQVRMGVWTWLETYRSGVGTGMMLHTTNLGPQAAGSIPKGQAAARAVFRGVAIGKPTVRQGALTVAMKAHRILIAMQPIVIVGRCMVFA